MKTVQLFPRFVEQEMEQELEGEVSMRELEDTLKILKKEKSPGPDGWTVEFYVTFFEILGADLLKIIEESKKRGRIPGNLKATFIALIPKFDKPSSFDGFQPISLCNCIYKIIAKIIANRLKPILLLHIAQEQFSFLHNRQIHEAIGTAQELLHSIQYRKTKGMILKIDLSKAFDRVNWLYLRLLLTHIGFPYSFIKWIMSYLTDVPFCVLITARLPHFFMQKGDLDKDVPCLCFCSSWSCLSDLKALHQVMGLFQKATGMVLNESKSTLSALDCAQNELLFTLRRFPFVTSSFEEGLRYLGYRLNPFGYKIADWIWLITKVEKRLNICYHKYLSRAGRLILIKAILEATPVYWMTLAWIPRGILDRLQKICCRFLWKGNQIGKTFAWTRWETLALPKRWGGWGIK
eukprot:PITA_09728